MALNFRPALAKLPIALAIVIALGAYWFLEGQLVDMRHDLTDLSPVMKNGEKPVLIGDGTDSTSFPALLYVTCMDGLPSRLIASWRMAAFKQARSGSFQESVSLAAFQREPRKWIQQDIKRGYELTRGQYRHLVAIPPLGPEEIVGVSELLTQHPDWQHSFHATERYFRFQVTDKGRAGLRGACSNSR